MHAGVDLADGNGFDRLVGLGVNHWRKKVNREEGPMKVDHVRKAYVS